MRLFHTSRPIRSISRLSYVSTLITLSFKVRCPVRRLELRTVNAITSLGAALITTTPSHRGPITRSHAAYPHCEGGSRILDTTHVDELLTRSDSRDAISSSPEGRIKWARGERAISRMPVEPICHAAFWCLRVALAGNVMVPLSAMFEDRLIQISSTNKLRVMPCG